MEPLGENEVKKELSCLNQGWELVGDKKIRHQFCFENFDRAIEFVDKVAIIANKLDHHPDISIHYDKVEIELTTHNANGLTQIDFDAAIDIEKIFDKMVGKIGRVPM